MAASDHLHPGQMEGQMQLFQPPAPKPAESTAARPLPSQSPNPGLEEHRRFSAEAPMRIRGFPQDAGEILRGGYKTQHETGYSGGGTFDPDWRQSFEHRTWGEGSRPSYGYFSHGDVRDEGFGEHYEEESVSHYGSMALELKESLRPQTTYTPGDSLDIEKEFVGKPGQVVTPPVDRSSWDFVGYTEMQVHKPVGREDIQRAILYKDGPHTYGEDNSYQEQQDARDDSARSDLRSFGVPHETRQVKEHAQEPLPLSSEDWGDATLVDGHDPVTRDKLPFPEGMSSAVARDEGLPRRQMPETKWKMVSETLQRWSPESGEWAVGKGGVVSPRQFKPKAP